MADVTGPISTLPGSIHRLPAGAMCDDHPDRPAVKRIQGETDSFGSEMNDLCQECVDALNQAEPTEGQCQWCHATAILKPQRDWEEGSSGPIYYVCSNCITKNRESSY